MQMFHQPMTCEKCEKNFIVVGSTNDIHLTTGKDNAIAYDMFSTKDLIGFTADCVKCSHPNKGIYKK